MIFKNPSKIPYLPPLAAVAPPNSGSPPHSDLLNPIYKSSSPSSAPSIPGLPKPDPGETAFLPSLPPPEGAFPVRRWSGDVSRRFSKNFSGVQRRYSAGLESSLNRVDIVGKLSCNYQEPTDTSLATASVYSETGVMGPGLTHL